MKFTTLTPKEFTKFANTHPQLTFHQTLEWGKLKEQNHWRSHFVGVKDNKKVIAASLLLEKVSPLHKSIFYSPRGFLIDYEDQKLLSFFTEHVKNYVKNSNGFLLKLDPYILYQERDNKGEIIENGKNNQVIVDQLKKLGYKHLGFTKMNETLQPRWMFVLNLKDKDKNQIQKNFDSKTKRILKKNAKMLIEVRELTKEELPIFKEIMQSTSNRREFIDRPLSYYENMWNEFHDQGHLKVMVAQLPVTKYIKSLKQEQKQIKQEIKERKERKKHESVNEAKYELKQKEATEKCQKIEKQLEEMQELEKEYGQTIILGGMLFLLYGKEIVFLMGGSFEQFLHFQSSYSIHEAMIDYAIENHYDIYNFYGITGIFDESNPLYGIYFAKKGFGGNVVELIGEFDLVVSKPYYYLYKVLFFLYHTSKNFLHHIKKK